MVSNFESCKKDCTDINGHLPYFYDVDLILSQLYENNSINDLDFPDFRRMNMQNDKELTFYVSVTGLRKTTTNRKIINIDFAQNSKVLTRAFDHIAS